MDVYEFVIFLVVGFIFLSLGKADGTPICYSRERLDDRYTAVKRVTCEESEDQLYKMFPSKENVNILDLLDVTCSFEELPDVLGGKFRRVECTGRRLNDTCILACDHGHHLTSPDGDTTCQDQGGGKSDWSPGPYSCHAFNCSFDELPNILNGSIQKSNCSGNSGGDVCYVTCDEGFYVDSFQQTICQYSGSNEGTWSNQGNLSCYAPSCPFSELSSIINGVFDVNGCSGNSEGDFCKMTCPENYHPSLPNYTICEHVGTEIGQWTQADFVCIAPSCPFSELPSVTNGVFDVTACSGNFEGDFCNITCPENYYPGLPSHTICKTVGSEIGQWTLADFTCIAKCIPSWHGHSYTWVNTKMDWSHADLHCRSLSAHLVYINDYEENNFVKSLTNCDGHVLPDGSSAWIGLTYLAIGKDEIRLAGGSDRSEGRVEVFHDGVWSTVCDDGWDITDGLVTCRQLGFPTVQSVYSSAHFGQGSGKILLDNVECRGSEYRLIDCPHIGFYSHNCVHGEDAGVRCTSVWQDGTEVIYSNWIAKHLQNPGDCVGIDNNGFWNIDTCDSLHYFICEKE